MERDLQARHSQLQDHYVWLCGKPDCTARAMIRQYTCGCISVDWLHQGCLRTARCEKAPRARTCNR